jgi:hypothetical protein
MTNFSPAAQAVQDAVLAFYADVVPREAAWAVDAEIVAAALRAAADQVALRWAELEHPSDILNAIADELETQ